MLKTIGPKTVVVRSEEPLSAELDKGLVLFSVASGKYYSFNPVTTAVWNALASPISVLDLCLHLRTRFDVTPSECEADVLSLLEDLRQRALVTVVDPSPLG